jgi:predicted alpha-1,2-mannosidase
MKKSILLFALLAICPVMMVVAQKDYTRYALPMAGTYNEHKLSHGNLYPCIARPWGMNHWTPQTANNGDTWQYTYSSYQITGLKQTHQPSPWIGDYGVFSLMPTTGPAKFLESERKSWFSHKAEEALPHYYKVYLADYDITAELAPTERGCVMQFTYPESDDANVVIDAFDKDSYIKVIPSQNKVIGYSTFMNSPDFRATKLKNYFVITFDKDIKSWTVWKNQGFENDANEASGERTGIVVKFQTKKGEKIIARIASSFISNEQAELNFKREVAAKSYDQVKKEGQEIWNSHLSRFEVEDANLDDLDNVRMFYTALYRILLFPRELHEYDAAGNIVHYSPFSGKVLPGRLYTDNGFWDTFRAVHPFFNLFYPEQSQYIMEGLANTFKESGWLPEWASPGHVDCMVGSNSTSIIASAWLNGVKNIDINTLWDGMYKNAYEAHQSITSVGRAGAQDYDRLGYVPNDTKVRESAARTLEYAYADFCLWKLAIDLKKDDKTIETFKKRSLNYKNIYYDKYKLMAGKNSKGQFRSDFNPFAWGGDFTEGNSWHYSWSVFHDPAGLIQLMGGKEAFTGMLDSVFNLPPIFDEKAYGSVIHEIREMQIMDFGQYAHGNQPVQHMIYLYNWSGEPWKSQYWARQVMGRLYSPTPNGYCGDEDNGQTSAWYVFSVLGFYPVCPVTGEYAIGSPLFRKLNIKLANGKHLTIEAPENNNQNVYVNKLSLNGRIYPKNFFEHKELQNGGSITFEMNSKPNMQRGINEESFPYSFSK